MATWKPENLIVKGAIAEFHDALDNIPTIYQNHCMIVPSTAAVEQYVWPGHLPVPRQFVDGRNIQGLRDFTYSLTNQTYELTISLDRTFFEDDQVGLMAARMREIAEVWGTYKDFLFVQLLINGATAGNLGYDGTVFYGDTRTEGDSANIDNDFTAAAATAEVPTTSEFFQLGHNVNLAAMKRYQDDHGRPMNTMAASKIRYVVPPSHEPVLAESANATFFAAEGGAGSRENVFKGSFEFDSTPYLSSDTTTYMNAVGSERKPFIYQERTPLEVIVLDDPDSIALHDAVLVLCRQRFIFAYGEFRRSLRMVWS